MYYNTDVDEDVTKYLAWAICIVCTMWLWKKMMDYTNLRNLCQKVCNVWPRLNVKKRIVSFSGSIVVFLCVIRLWNTGGISETMSTWHTHTNKPCMRDRCFFLDIICFSSNNV